MTGTCTTSLGCADGRRSAEIAKRLFDMIGSARPSGGALTDNVVDTRSTTLAFAEFGPQLAVSEQSRSPFKALARHGATIDHRPNGTRSDV